ncbi:unnamed protein product [Camellia sinensis]
MDNHTGNWWLQLQDVVLGYWPGSIFTGLADSSTLVAWGGEIINLRSARHHTTTQMGSGHFPFEGYGKSSFFYNLKVIDKSNTLQDPASLQPYATDSACYDLHVAETKILISEHIFTMGVPDILHNAHDDQQIDVLKKKKHSLI